jgi:adenine phosphoribosyltransferase
VLATGGTAEAAVHLLRKAGAEVSQALFVLELVALGGAARLAAQQVGPAALVRL